MCPRRSRSTNALFGGSALWMEFDKPVDIVQIGGAWLSDFIWMKAYDENYQTLDVQAVPEDVLLRDESGYNKGFSRVDSVNSLVGNIKYVIAGSVGGRIGLDAISYQTVVRNRRPFCCVALASWDCSGADIVRGASRSVQLGPGTLCSLHDGAVYSSPT